MATRIPRMPEVDEPIPVELDLRCTNCGYELAGLTKRRCPECGRGFDPRDTWLANERSTWAFHFEHIRSKEEYGQWGLLAVLMVSFVGLSVLHPVTCLVLPLLVVCELLAPWSGGSGLRLRLFCWAACVLWGMVVALAW